MSQDRELVVGLISDIHFGPEAGYGGTLTHPAPFSRCTNYGANAADSTGMTIPGNATANTEGAWTAVGSALVVPLREISLCIGSLKDEDYWAVVNFILIANESAVPPNGVNAANASTVEIR